DDEGALETTTRNLDVLDLLGWFAVRRAAIADPDLATLSSLPLFPSSGGRYPLTELQMPGDFKGDPLGLSRVVDITGMSEGVREFLGPNGLGAKELSFRIYVTELLPEAFAGQHSPSPTQIEALVDVLADQLAVIRSEQPIRGVLGDLPILRLRNKEFVAPA